MAKPETGSPLEMTARPVGSVNARRLSPSSKWVAMLSWPEIPGRKQFWQSVWLSDDPLAAKYWSHKELKALSQGPVIAPAEFDSTHKRS